MGKSIKELAEDLGVTKAGIRKYLTAEFRDAYVETLPGNSLVINDDGCKQIAWAMGKISETEWKQSETSGNQFSETSGNTGNQILQEELAFLRAQLEAKDRQIEQKDQQLAARDAQIASLTTALENTTSSLQAAQALHAGTIQQQITSGEAGDEPAPEQEPKKSWLHRVFRRANG